ncbi:MAG: AraC family transcriptional regulator [Methylacidiphilales bacterium]|nr:AraC family transcriptional regulator [Candidatus Methylacidiphilales bacterium]
MRFRPQIYINHAKGPVSDQAYIPAMGLHELMPPGLIRHGGVGSGHPCLIMIFHSEARSLAPNGTEWAPCGCRLIVWPRDAFHHYGHREKRWDHSWLQVSGRWIDRTLRHTPVPLGVPINLGDDALPLRHLRLISEELRGNVQQDPEMLQGLLQVFWRAVERQVNAGPDGRRLDPRLEKARRFIETRFDRPFKLAEAAEQAHLSTSHFCSCFSSQFGVAPYEYAMRLRLQRGAQLLANRELAVFQVAEMAGCPDALYFSRLFHKRYGLSPTQFRRRQSQSTIKPTD